MFEGIFDHPIWDIILLIVLIRVFIPFLFQIRVYSAHNEVRKPSSANRQAPPGKVTITTSDARTRHTDAPGEYVEFEEIKQ